MHTSLYNDPKLDITQQVIIAMDKTYSTSHMSCLGGLRRT